MVGGLVQDQEIGLGEHQLGQGDPASLAAAQVSDALKHVVAGEQEGGQHVADLGVVHVGVGVLKSRQTEFSPCGVPGAPGRNSRCGLWIPDVISPESGASRSFKIFKMVVFPVPLFPMMATRSPRLMSKSTSLEQELGAEGFGETAHCQHVVSADHVWLQPDGHLIVDLRRFLQPARFFPAFSRGFPPA